VSELVHDSAPPADASPRPDRGGALSFWVVAAIFATLLALGVSLAVVIHRSYVGFARIAAYHVPPDTSLVLRWDVEKVSLFEPTRRFLLPLLDVPHAAKSAGTPPNATGTPAKAAKTRRDRFADLSGSMLGRDLREAVALFGPGEHDWAVVLAGSFREGDLVAAAQQTLANDGWTWRSLGPGRIASPEGFALGRAADGALVIASSAERLDAVLVPRDALPEVPRVGAGALRLLPSPTGLPAGTPALLASLGDVRAVTGSAKWGSPMPIEVTVEFAQSPPADAKDRIRRLLARLLGDDLARIERQEAPVSVKSAGNHALTVTVLLDDVALERVANRAAETVEQALGPGAGAGIRL
jgi:hypothetical protein